eukprot:1899779-Rhodomonas_salina.2
MVERQQKAFLQHWQLRSLERTAFRGNGARFGREKKAVRGDYNWMTENVTVSRAERSLPWYPGTPGAE